MKLSINQINELIINIAGDDVPPLIALLKNRKNVSEFKLADDLNITVNQIRNMLYRLHKHNLVHFNRKKDKKKGWYIYYWTLNLNNTKIALLNFKKQQLEDFKGRLDKEQGGIFYVCPNRCRRYAMDTAMELDFRCQECGELVSEQDNSRTIVNIKDRIKELELEVANAELFEAKKFAIHGAKPKVKKTAKKATAGVSAKIAVVKKVPKKAVKKVPKKAVKKVPKKAVKKVVKKAVKKTAKKAPAKKSILKKVLSKVKKK